MSTGCVTSRVTGEVGVGDGLRRIKITLMVLSLHGKTVAFTRTCIEILLKKKKHSEPFICVRVNIKLNLGLIKEPI